MPRKAAATSTTTESTTEPRRSSRIKDLPKPDLPKKAPPKPRVKKDKVPAGESAAEAPKRGKKRAAEEPNGAEPAAKKVRPFNLFSTLFLGRLELMI